MAYFLAVFYISRFNAISIKTHSLKDPCACLVALFIPWRRTRSYTRKFPPSPTYSSVLHSNFFDICFFFGFTLISVIGKDKQIRFISTTQYDYYT